MNISFAWLQDILKQSLSVQEVSDRLSVSGLEVEHVATWESVPGALQGFVIGEVVTCEKHPDADRLHVTTVNIGGAELLSIVCGAPNVAARQKVVVATVGTTIHMEGKEPFEIKKSKIRGAVSEGMICAEDEIGIGTSHDGILILPQETPVGIPAADFFGVVRDTVLEIGLTANRGDAASHLGVARDIAALFGLPLPQIRTKNATLESVVSGTSRPERSVRIEHAELSHAYIGVHISGVKIGPSPQWLQHRLKAIGIVPKNNVVDATNYVLHHTGQPVHAFDAALLTGDIAVRKASPEERLKLLDGREIVLDVEDLVIADARGPQALAGVMGGAHTAVTEDTTALFLEVAHFHSGSVRKSAKRHVIHSDASFRFERGIDELGLERTALFLSECILELAGGTVEGFNRVMAQEFVPKQLEFSKKDLDAFAGTEYPVERIQEILRSLGFSVSGEAVFQVGVPSWRNDVSHAVDLYEEVMRIFGYDAIPMVGKMNISLGSFQGMQKKKREDQLRSFLVDQGFYEAQTNSLVSPDWYAEGSSLVPLSNPLSADLSVMRGSMIPGLLQSVAYNQNRQAKSVKLFELGRIYERTEQGYKEVPTLALVVWGDWELESWEAKRRLADYFDVKRVIQGLLQRLDASVSIEDMDIQTVSPKWTKRAEVKGTVYAWEFPLKKLYKSGRKSVKVQPVSKFFGMRRDLSLVVDADQGFDRWMGLVRQSKVKYLQDVRVFDVFEGAPLEKGKKSISMSFHFHRAEQTMEDKDADQSMEKLMSVFESNGAIIRR